MDLLLSTMGFITTKTHHLGPTIFGSLFPSAFNGHKSTCIAAQSREVVPFSTCRLVKMKPQSLHWSSPSPVFWVGNTSESEEDLEDVFFWDGVLFLLVLKECSSAKTCMKNSTKNGSWNLLKLIIFHQTHKFLHKLVLSAKLYATPSLLLIPSIGLGWLPRCLSIFQDTKTVRRCTWIWVYGPIAFMLCEPGKPGKFGGKTGEPWNKGPLAGACLGYIGDEKLPRYVGIIS